MSDFSHLPVLLREVLDSLAPQAGQVYVDLTLGGAGHAKAVAAFLGPSGTLIGVDQDPDALAAAHHNLSQVDPEVRLRLGNFADFDLHLRALGLAPVAEGGGADCILADLGVSSHQLDTGHRGFSFMQDAPLDMRMSQNGETAHELLLRVSPEELADILYHYGDIRESRRLARAMHQSAASGALQTTSDLAALCERVLGRAKKGKTHPATRAFQALRIAVNDEMGAIDQLIAKAPSWIKPGGRLSIITFHSGEDRRIKQAFRQWANPCNCPLELPQCVCHAVPLGKPLTRKALEAKADELADNPRARSAKLRTFVFGAP